MHVCVCVCVCVGVCVCVCVCACVCISPSLPHLLAFEPLVFCFVCFCKAHISDSNFKRWPTCPWLLYSLQTPTQVSHEERLPGRMCACMWSPQLVWWQKDANLCTRAFASSLLLFSFLLSGTAVVRELAANYADKVRIRCVVRRKANAKHLQGLPIEVINADITQPHLLKAVFADDVNACFWSTPTTESA